MTPPGPSALEAAVRFGVPDVWIEYPQPGEVVRRPHYTLQVCASSEAVGVDVSIDGGDWRPCRESMGLWWYDWTGFSPGQHHAFARIALDDGRLEVSQPRRFIVAA
jgi:hypothetical protein